jgi:transposase
MKVPAAGDDHKSMLYGALDYATGQVIWQHYPQKGTEAFTAFLTHLAATLPADEPVVVVLDNASYHKSRAVAALWQRDNQRLQSYFLPAYAPQLNLIERLWRYLKAQLANHRWWHDLDRLQQAADALLRHLTVHFHADEEPAFHLVQDLCQPA